MKDFSKFAFIYLLCIAGVGILDLASFDVFESTRLIEFKAVGFVNWSHSSILSLDSGGWGGGGFQ